ncbi:MAG: hypothetical protein PHI49_10145 [Halothiobacillaceae bacterium]|nr:hypothetical protein [Halothiobacillaceae bacterium]
MTIRVRLYQLPNGDILGAGGWVTSPEGDHYEIRWTSPVGDPIYDIPYETLKQLAENRGALVWDEALSKLVLEKEEP